MAPMPSAELHEDMRRVAQDRDKEAFCRLFDYYAPRIKGYLLRLGLSGSVAEDVTQDVMMTLWHKAAQFDVEKSSLTTWLYRVARNRRIDLARKIEPETYAPGESIFDVDITVLNETGLDERRMEASLVEALKTLPKEQKDLLMLSFYEDLSHSQIAEQTGIPLGTVKSRIRLAFKKLQTYFQDDVMFQSYMDRED